MSAPHDWLLGGVIAFLVTTITTPAGVSGAVFLLPVQIGVLHVPNPALTPTNLLYNVLSTPGALARFAREGRLGSPLTRALLIGTVPGVLLGAALRVELLSGPRAFLLIVAAGARPAGGLAGLRSNASARSARPPTGRRGLGVRVRRRPNWRRLRHRRRIAARAAARLLRLLAVRDRARGAHFDVCDVRRRRARLPGARACEG